MDTTNSRILSIILTTILLVALLSGCSAPAPSPFDSETIVSMYPSNGAAAVPPHTDLMVDVGWDVAEDAVVEATLANELGHSEELRCHREADDDCWYVCPAAAQLVPDTRYTFTASLDGVAQASTTFTTAAPEGNGYEVGQHLVVEQLGANETAANKLTDLMAGSGPSLMVTEGILGAENLPAQDTTWMWGPGRQLAGDEEHYAVSRAVGYTAVMNVTVDESGTIHGGADAVYLACELDGEWMFVRIDAVTVRGRMNPDEAGLPIRHFTLEGIVTSTTITRLVDDIDEDLQPLVYALFEADVDTDGDGEDDAAAVRITTQGLPVTVQPPQ